MIVNLHIILLVCALLCFLGSTIGVVMPRVNLQSLGLAFLTAALLV